MFNTVAQIGGFAELIRPDSFRATLASGSDVRALVDHNPGLLLGRTSAQTLRLSESSLGLEFEIDMADTVLGRDTYTMAQRGDVRACSFAFTLPADGTGEVWTNRTTRELRNVVLHEISILTGQPPAYDTTTVAARARGMGRCDAARMRRLLIEVI